MLVPHRHTVSSQRKEHFSTSSEAKELWAEAMLQRSRSAPRLVHHYVQAGGPAPESHRPPPGSHRPAPRIVAYGGASRTTIRTYSRCTSVANIKQRMHLVYQTPMDRPETA